MNLIPPPPVIEIVSKSSVAVALSIVTDLIVAPPVKEEAVEVVAPLPVTEASVAAS